MTEIGESAGAAVTVAEHLVDGKAAPEMLRGRNKVILRQCEQSLYALRFACHGETG
jgi:hypothetical protein